MDSKETTEIKKSIKTLLEEFKNEIELGKKSLKSGNSDLVSATIANLEKVYNQMLTKSRSKDTLEGLLKVQEDLEENKADLISQIENTQDSIWSVDKNLQIKTINSVFVNYYKIAFGVTLKKGLNVLVSLPEPLKSVWKERYKRTLEGEQFSIVDTFDINNVPYYTDTSFNPIRVNNEIIGVACFSRDITPQKENEERYKTFIDNIPNVTYRCLFDEHRTIKFISEEVESLTGYKADEFLENKVLSFASIIHTDDKILIDNTIKNSIKRKKSYQIEYRIVHKNKTIKWVHERGRASLDENNNVLWLDGVISDITTQKQSENALRESEEQYRSIFNSMSDIFLRTDLDGNILIITPSIIDLLGYSPEEVVGKKIAELYKNNSDKGTLLAKLKEKGFVREYELTFKAKNGESHIISINAKLLNNDAGKPYAIEGIARDITSRKVAQQTLEERTQELNTIFENTPIILLLIDSEGNVLNINKAGSHFAHHNKSEVLNLLTGEAINCVNTVRTKLPCGKEELCKTCAIRNAIDKTIKTRLNQNQVEGIITIVENGQEKERKFLISTTYIEFKKKGRILISLDDITEMRLAEEEITRLSAAVNQSTATIVITDIKGLIEYVNPQFEKSTGYKANEVIGKNPRMLKSRNTSAETYKKLWATITAGETWHGEFNNTRKNGSQYWESAIISPITNKSGEITHFLAIKEDISERKRIQEDLVKSEQTLREINDEKSRYLSILAHDLRGLVGSFHAYTDLIHAHFDEFTTNEFKEQLQNLSKVSGESLNLLDNLLDWGKTTQGRLTLKKKRFNLKEETDVVIRMLSEIANNKNIKLVNKVPDNIHILTDINSYQTIVRNLINNSIKFTPTNGFITITAEKTEKFYEVSVIDTGVGMDDAIKNKLFKMGENVVREGTNEEHGTGLGLVICKETVKKLDGTIAVESEPGKGSRFFFRIPL